jgi:alanine racemase
MDQCMIDVTNIDCCVGDVVTVFSDQREVSADAIAAHIGTINYEVVCDVGERVPRVYIQNDEVVSIRDAIYNA